MSLITHQHSLSLSDKLQEAQTLDKMLDIVQHEISVGLSQQKIFFHKGTAGKKKWTSSHESDWAEEKQFAIDFYKEATSGLGIIEQKGLDMLAAGELSYEEYDQKVGLFLYNTRKNLSVRLMDICRPPAHNPPMTFP